MRQMSSASASQSASQSDTEGAPDLHRQISAKFRDHVQPPVLESPPEAPPWPGATKSNRLGSADKRDAESPLYLSTNEDCQTAHFWKCVTHDDSPDRTIELNERCSLIPIVIDTLSQFKVGRFSKISLALGSKRSSREDVNYRTRLDNSLAILFF